MRIFSGFICVFIFWNVNFNLFLLKFQNFDYIMNSMNVTIVLYTILFLTLMSDNFFNLFLRKFIHSPYWLWLKNFIIIV